MLASVRSRPQTQGGDLLTLVSEDPPTAAESARRSLARLELAGIRQRNAIRARFGLSDDELTTLLHLLEHSRLTQRQLLAVCTLTRSGVGAMVTRLETAGLIERVQDPGDKRVRLLQLSARGAAHMHAARGAYDDALVRLLDECPDSELEALSRLLSAAAEATEQDAASPTPTGRRTSPSAQRDWRRWG
jgi:DNA-binding MarR family transcriptional regulator